MAQLNSDSFKIDESIYDVVCPKCGNNTVREIIQWNGLPYTYYNCLLCGKFKWYYYYVPPEVEQEMEQRMGLTAPKKNNDTNTG